MSLFMLHTDTAAALIPGQIAGARWTYRVGSTAGPMYIRCHT